MLQLAVTTGQLVAALALRGEHLQQVIDLDLLRDGDATKLLDVALLPRIRELDQIIARARSR